MSALVLQRTARLTGGEHVAGDELALRFEIRAPSGRTPWERKRPRVVATVLTSLLALAWLCAMFVMFIYVRGSVVLFGSGMLFVAYRRVFNALTPKLAVGRVTPDAVIARARDGMRAIPLSEIRDVLPDRPAEHFGATLVLANGEQVLLDCGLLDVAAGTRTSDGRAEREQLAAELDARQALLVGELDERRRAWAAAHADYRTSANLDAPAHHGRT